MALDSLQQEMPEHTPTEPGPRPGLRHSLAPARKLGLVDQVTAGLREGITQGYFKPGERLREDEIAQSFEVSRGPVREAFAILEKEGLVLVRPNRGTFVARLSLEDVEQVYSLRLALERLAMEWALRNATEEDFDALDACLKRMQLATAGGRSQLESAEMVMNFHELLVRAAHHERLFEFWSNLRAQVFIILLSINSISPNYLEGTFEHHLLLVNAMKTRRPEIAIPRIEQHLQVSYENILRLYPTSTPATPD